MDAVECKWNEHEKKNKTLVNSFFCELFIYWGVTPNWKNNLYWLDLLSSIIP